MLCSRFVLDRCIHQIHRNQRRIRGKFAKTWTSPPFDCTNQMHFDNLFLQKKVVTTSTNVEPEKTYILRVQKRKFIAEIPEPKVAQAPSLPTSDVQERLKPIAEMDLHVLPRHSLTGGKLFRSDSDSDMGSNTNISSRHNLGLVVIVYGSATLVYIQLMLLAVCLQSAATPPGLIFLVSSLGLIGYIVYKVSNILLLRFEFEALAMSFPTR